MPGSVAGSSKAVDQHDGASRSSHHVGRNTGIVCLNEAARVETAVKEENGVFRAKYEHNYVRVAPGAEGETFVAKQVKDVYGLETRAKPQKTGIMIVGLGGNNGTTLAAGILANKQKLTWETKEGVHQSNWLGSVAMMGTMKIGTNEKAQEVYAPIRSLVPLLHPDDIEVSGWDISARPLSAAMRNAKVLPLELQRQLEKDMDKIEIRPGFYDHDFIATNQKVRADYTIRGDRQAALDQIRADIQAFRAKAEVENVIVFWSGNTERFSEHNMDKCHGHEESLLEAIRGGDGAGNESHSHDIAPSLIYAVAAVLEGCAYINGSPQNTFCPALVEMAEKRNVLLVGDDLKTGQTKLKSVLADFFVSTALKPTALVSYNHLGNNDGLNLSSEAQFRSKEVTKVSVVDDLIASNSMMFPDKNSEPDHLIVIKYIPSVGDSKRAMDEYTNRLFLDGQQTIVVHNTCEDSLLAAPIMLDLVIFAELLQRVTITNLSTEGCGTDASSKAAPGKVKMASLASLLSLFCKAPQVPEGAPIINALFPQKEALLDFLRALVNLPPTDYVSLPHRLCAAGANDSKP